MFLNREDGARQLAQRLLGRKLFDPLVLAIPRGGVATGAVLAEELDAELDVILARKLRCPGHPELALGAISESGAVHLNPTADDILAERQDYLADERRFQLEEIARLKAVFRELRPVASIAGRTVIVTDDGVATGSTMIAALQTVREQHPKELIVAVPVGPKDTVAELRRWADEVVCLLIPDHFYAVGQFYAHFEPIEGAEAVRLLHRAVVRREDGRCSPTSEKQ